MTAEPPNSGSGCDCRVASPRERRLAMAKIAMLTAVLLALPTALVIFGLRSHFRSEQPGASPDSSAQALDSSPANEALRDALERAADQHWAQISTDPSASQAPSVVPTVRIECSKENLSAVLKSLANAQEEFPAGLIPLQSRDQSDHETIFLISIEFWNAHLRDQLNSIPSVTTQLISGDLPSTKFLFLEIPNQNEM